MKNKFDYRRKNVDRGPKKNHQITAQTVLLIDDIEGNLGEVPIQVAMAKAHDADKDLVEVSSQADPPVVKIIDYSKYLYEQRKKQKQNSKAGKVKDMKEFRFTPVIEQNDIDFKVKRAFLYLDKGHAVRITMYKKGRQTKEQSDSKFTEILTKFEGYSTIEPGPKREGRRTYITFKSDGTTKKQENSSKKDEKIKPKGKEKG